MIANTVGIPDQIQPPDGRAVLRNEEIRATDRQAFRSIRGPSATNASTCSSRRRQADRNQTEPAISVIRSARSTWCLPDSDKPLPNKGIDCISGRCVSLRLLSRHQRRNRRAFHRRKDQCPSYFAPWSIHRPSNSISRTVRCLLLSAGGIICSGSDVLTRRKSSLSVDFPATTAGFEHRADRCQTFWGVEPQFASRLFLSGP